jgi:hypothetical protein
VRLRSWAKIRNLVFLSLLPRVLCILPVQSGECRLETDVIGLLRRARPAAGGPDPIVKILHRKKFAIQLIACHTVAMECYRRAMNSQLPARDYHLNQANKLSRTYATLLESLNKHRGKGQQKVTVEHVHVHQGGQAIVGHVEHKGEGGWRKNRGSTPCKDD